MQDPVWVLKQKQLARAWIRARAESAGEIWSLARDWIWSKPELVGVLEDGSGALRSGSGWIKWNPDPLSGSGLDRISRCRNWLTHTITVKTYTLNSLIENSGVKTLGPKNWKYYLYYILKSLRLLRKLEMIRRRTDTIKFK